MNTKKEKTTPNTSVVTDAERSNPLTNINSISDKSDNFNYLDDFFIMQREMMDPFYLKTFSMQDLYETTYKSKLPIIDGLLYAGTYIFAGAPKLGKSFLMAQLGYHISTGKELWNYPTQKGSVLYLALEDDYSRLQKRLYRMFGTESTPDLYFSTSVNKLNNGLDEQLNRFITEHTDTKLIIIDTLQKIRDIGGDSYSYANDYEIISQLKVFADMHKICLILVHHTRKQKADDRFDMISGTNGLLGAADGAFILQKEKRTSNCATLEISGRDQQDQKLYLVRNIEKLSWEIEQCETELWKEPQEPVLEKISEFINLENPKWQGSPTELVNCLGLDLKANSLTYKLNINAGRLLNEYCIKYENNRNHNGRKVSLYFENKPYRDDV